MKSKRPKPPASQAQNPEWRVRPPASARQAGTPKPEQPRPLPEASDAEAEPMAAARPVPVWLWAALAVGLGWAGWYVWRHGGYAGAAVRLEPRLEGTNRTDSPSPALRASSPPAGERAGVRGRGSGEGEAGWFSGRLYDPWFTHAALAAANPKPPADLRDKGRLVYERTCQPCHQATGLGVPGQFPPLAGSDWVLAEGPGRLGRIVLHGLAGPITVKGAGYHNNMFAFRDLLSDADLAAVLTFIRNAWGNQARPIRPEEVRRLREATAARATPWTEAELLRVPAQE